MAQTLESLGIEPGPLFASAGIKLDTLTDPNTRMPSGAFRNVLLQIEQCPEAAGFGLKIARFIHPTTFYSLGVAAYCSDTLGDYVARMVRYYAVVTTNDRIDMEVADDLCCLRWVHYNPLRFPALREDGIAAVFFTILRYALHEGFSLERVDLARSMPSGGADLYQNFFGCPVYFDAAATALTFSEALLAQPLVSADPALAAAYEQLTEQYVAQLEKADFPARVRNELIRLLPTGVSGKEQVARELCVSTRTLYNRLEEAGTTYREVLDDTRKILSEQYLSKGLPVNEIAYLTGFSDTANFSRAFKKWTGSAPVNYREALSGKRQQ